MKGDPDMDAAEWRKLTVDSGWAVPSYPAEYCGRDLEDELLPIVEEEFKRVEAPSPGHGPGLDWVCLYMTGTLLAHGSDYLKQTFIGRLLRGEMGEGALFYSEPGAGSDLAGLLTRADRDGAGYLINGQKIWNSAANAGWGLMAARTNWDVPKHRGISFFLFPIKVDGVLQPGIDIRPIRMMNGQSYFTEVFFTDAWVPAENLVGQENDGWRVLQTALGFERTTMGSKNGVESIYRGRVDDAELEQQSGPEIFTEAVELIRAARKAGRNTDPAVRQAIAQIHTWRMIQAWNSRRSAGEIEAKGSSRLASLSKLANSRIVHSGAALLRLLGGCESLLYDYSDPEQSAYNFRAMGAFANSLGGGTDQIQRNIIGERILGLPKGPDLYRNVAFKDAPKDAAIRQFS